ncbi:hypothetical protein DPMN_018681 [Dreissena polymorpha]|uniref:Uncharacterized protein n=1 Tax=Dreissena polymorpha TaxID=45954 RepID=A0A9D4S8L1_DREPO|nr:hypothetical protein DPMN_018681 [Dreissena polymorpha]
MKDTDLTNESKSNNSGLNADQLPGAKTCPDNLMNNAKSPSSSGRLRRGFLSRFLDPQNR